MTLSAEPVDAWPSAAPVRVRGTRTRSGNAMPRTRAALLDAAEHCISRYGVRRTTMGDVALKAAVAKATLYNHFRTKDDLLAGLVEARVEQVAQAGRAAAEQGVAAVLAAAAEAVCDNQALRRVVIEDPALAARLATGGSGRSWRQAVDAVRSVLSQAAGADVDDVAVLLALRWLTSLVLWPADEATVRGQAERVAAAVAVLPQRQETPDA